MKYEKLVQFGKNLRAQRVRQSYSLEKMGQIAHLNPSHIAKIERGEMNPTLLTILNLTEALDIGLDKLV